MSRPTASPPPNEGVRSERRSPREPSDDDERQAIPPRGACQPILLGANGPRACRERCARRPPPDQPALKPFGGALRC